MVDQVASIRSKRPKRCELATHEVPGTVPGAEWLAWVLHPVFGRLDATGPDRDSAVANLERRIRLDELGVYRPQMALSPDAGAFGSRSTRMALWRAVLPGGFRACLWIGLNPSTADATTDDPTTRKIAGFTKRWGYGSFTLGNLWPFRATDPRDLFARSDLAGSKKPSCPVRESERWLFAMADRAHLIVCAWGSHGARLGRSARVLALLEPFTCKMMCLGRCANGEPKHPVRLAYRTVPELMEPPCS